MQQRCNKLNHDMDTCSSEIGQFNRCVWSHGVNYNAAKSKSHKTAVQADEVELETMSKSSSHDAAMKKDDISARLGCIWDQTGCSNGCDMEAMDARCDRMSHDQEQCEGEIGQFNRCQWSHGENTHILNVDIHSLAGIGEDNTLDILLIVAGVVTTLFIIHQLYRWFKNREYQKLQSTEQYEEIQITSHAV